MYHERTAAGIKKRRTLAVVAIVCAAALALACWFGMGAIEDNLREQSALSLRNAILDGALQCCAIEGSYPSSLSYLEENYGLVINHDDYVITYESFAQNIPPSVVVLPR